jgi:tetratricopeptide (TPR) repeat protein
MITNSATRGCALLLVLLAAGCAAKGHPTLNQRLVKQGTPTIKYGPDPAAAPASAPEESFEEVIAKIRALTANGLTRPKTSTLPMIEGRDPELAAALAETKNAPTPDAYVRAALAYLRFGIRDEAYEQFRLALKIDPRDPAAHDGLARLWRDWGFLGVALGEAHRAVYYAPWSATANNTLGTILQALGDKRAAAATYEYVLLLDPGAAYAANNLCYMALQAGETARGIRRCEQAVALDPSLTTAWVNLAAISGGAPQGGEPGVRLTADAAGRAYAAGVGYAHDEQFGAAEAAFGVACGLNPSFTQACDQAAQASEQAQRHQQKR